MNVEDATKHFGGQDAWHGVIAPNSPFPPEKDRYHLYIGLFCPFAHRVNIVRHLRGLQEIIPTSIVKPYPKGDANGWPGWQFPVSNDEYTGATVDHLFDSRYLHEIYYRADENYKGRFSVPVLWDKKRSTIVNNESAEILRFLPLAFDSILPKDFSPQPIDLYPPVARPQIDAMSKWLQDCLNTGVYKAGFAPDQATYEANVRPVFAALNKLENIIKSNRGPYVLGRLLTEIDVRAFATIVRFDAVYVQHFKCNLGSIRHEYPVINNWLKYLYWDPYKRAFHDTTDFRHIKENYTKSHADINPKAITPLGPHPNVEAGAVLDVSHFRAGGVNFEDEKVLGLL